MNAKLCFLAVVAAILVAGCTAMAPVPEYIFVESITIDPAGGSDVLTIYDDGRVTRVSDSGYHETRETEITMSESDREELVNLLVSRNILAFNDYYPPTTMLSHRYNHTLNIVMDGNSKTINYSSEAWTGLPLGLQEIVTWLSEYKYQELDLGPFEYGFL